MISGTERITVGVLDGLKWVPPSARQRMPR